jgi:hypothetical protein
MNRVGGLLKDYPAVKKIADKYPTIHTKYWWNENNPYRPLPAVFDGRDEWKNYTQTPDDQKCSDAWAIVATDVLSDRYTILSVGQINLFLSSEEIVTCIQTRPLPRIEGVKSCNIYKTDNPNSCQGYSIFDAWEYLYARGSSETSCFSKRKMIKEKIPLANQLEFSQKPSVYDKICDPTNCLTTKDDKPVARRTFYLNAIFNIYETKPDGSFDLQKTVDTIKYELMRFGPVGAGFIVYENFLTIDNGVYKYNYDGKSVYEKAEGNPLGGHYVSIMGWEDDHWICRNSWGTDWGLLGFFKMKIGIAECMLEQNVSGCDPFFHQLKYDQFVSYDSELNGKRVQINDMKLFNPELAKLRDFSDIDEKTFYTKKTIQLIKDGKLYGNLSPLIKYPENLPDRNTYWADQFKTYTFRPENTVKNKEENINKEQSYFWYIIVIVLLCITAGYVGFTRNKK